jgi:hypothetical protein
MQDARWLRLRDCLQDRGWTTREGALYAPHATMWFSRTSDDASLSRFRDQIRNAAEASAQYVDLDGEHAALHDDLVSLVDALDEVFQN